MKLFASILLLFISFQLSAQEIIPLYPDKIPNSTNYVMKEKRLEQAGQFLGYSNISQPTLTVYLPEKNSATGAAVIICPGGGYGMESYRLEGTVIAESFQKQGIAAFILKYRLPSDSIMPDKSVGPLQDAQQAIKMVRQRAAEWNLNQSKIGIMGFSAGGHLASTAGTHFEKSYIPNDEKINLRPDFMVLVYPVISMKDGLTHPGSRTNLLGEKPTSEQITLFSNELQVNGNTPPTWLTHTGDDTVVPVENSIRFYQELIRNKVPAEMHLYPKGNHGFILYLKPEDWMQPIFDWIKKSVITQ
ncbi:MAG: alpha/beta hydrolase [Prolixibacteraceae bacterium]|jgi:acetyl esterase/lipase